MNKVIETVAIFSLGAVSGFKLQKKLNVKSNNKTSNSNEPFVLFESKKEAKDILDQMDSIVQTYGFATVADLSVIIGGIPEYKYENLYWDNLSKTKISRTSKGYKLKFPEPFIEY